MAGIDLTNDRRSELLRQLLSQQGQQRRPIQSGAELAAKLGEQLIRQQTKKKLQQEEAASANTTRANEVAVLQKMMGGGDTDFQGRAITDQQGNQQNNTTLAQALGQLPSGNATGDAISEAMIKQKFAAPKPRRTDVEVVKDKDEFVTQLIDLDTGDVLKELGRGPRKTVIEQTNFDGSALTKSAISKQVVDAREATKQVARQIRQATRSVEIAQADPASIGIPGNLVTFGNNMVQTAKALGSLFRDKDGNPVDVGADRSMDGIDFSGLRNSAANNAEFRSGIWGIAFAAAVATQGSRPTDKDIQAFVDQIAGSSSDPKAFARTINGFTQLTVQGLRDTVVLNPEINDKEAERMFGIIDPLMAKFDEQIAGGDAGRLEQLGF